MAPEGSSEAFSRSLAAWRGTDGECRYFVACGDRRVQEASDSFAQSCCCRTARSLRVLSSQNRCDLLTQGIIKAAKHFLGLSGVLSFSCERPPPCRRLGSFCPSPTCRPGIKKVQSFCEFFPVSLSANLGHRGSTRSASAATTVFFSASSTQRDLCRPRTKSLRWGVVSALES